MDWTRRNILAAGAAAAATAAVPSVFAQQSGKRGTGKFYERGQVRIYYEEAGSGFPLLLLPGGGLNSTISFFAGNSPFNAIEEFKRTVSLHHGRPAQRPRQSTGPVEVDRPVGILCRRPTRPDGSYGDRQVHGDGFLHWRPLHLESLEARTRSYSRRG